MNSVSAVGMEHGLKVFCFVDLYVVIVKDMEPSVLAPVTIQWTHEKSHLQKQLSWAGVRARGPPHK